MPRKKKTAEPAAAEPHIKERINRLWLANVRGNEKPAALLLSARDALELVGTFGFSPANCTSLEYMGMPVFVTETAVAPMALWKIPKAPELLAKS